MARIIKGEKGAIISRPKIEPIISSILLIMKIALVYDYLNQYGGGERVLEIFTAMFPQASLYTIFYDPQKTRQRFNNTTIKTSFLDFKLARDNHRWFIPLMPRAIESLDLSNQYDLIISIGASYARGISYQAPTQHLHYCFTPLRYAWEDRYIPPQIKNLNLLTKPLRYYLKQWDFQAAQKPDQLLTISNHIAQRIRRCYGRSAEVLPPPLDTKTFHLDSNIKKQNYFLAAGRLLHYKKFDLVIEAFNQLQLPLKIVGQGPELARLKKLARSPKIEFLGFVKSDAEMRRIYTAARALIFPQLEDFGLVAAEAQACGTPVIGFAQGGALDIINHGQNGLLFTQQTPECLAYTIKVFSRMSFDAKAINQSAERFSVRNFKLALVKHLKKLQKTS